MGKASALPQKKKDLRHSEPNYNQATAEIALVIGEESHCIKSEILRAKNDCYPQNDGLSCRDGKAQAYPFNASAGIFPKESSLLNNPKAGLLRCNTPRNDSKTRALTNSVVAQPPRNDSLNIWSEQGLPKPHNEKNLADCELSGFTDRRSETSLVSECEVDGNEVKSTTATSAKQIQDRAQGAHGGVEPAEQPVDPLNASNQAMPYYPSVLTTNSTPTPTLPLGEGAKRKAAFTLAEVLITLGIIGIVAAMTLPTLIAKYEKKQAAVRLKQTYAQLQEAIALSVVENGDIKEWNWPQENWFDTYIVKYLKLAQNKGEFKVFDSENQDEIDAGDYIPYKQISGQQETGLALLRKGFSNSSSYILANGVELIVRNNSNTIAGEFLVDLNTSSRKPNQFGKDAFIFSVFKDYGLQPSGMKPTSECPDEGIRDRDYLMSDSCFSYKCSKDGRGMWCGALIMSDGWEIKNDYPW